MIRPKDLSDCDCSPWQKLKQQIQALYEAVTQLGYKNTEQDGEIAGLDLRVTALEDAPVVPPEWGNITGDLEDQTDLKDALDGKADASSLAPVALSGDYDDLLNKPTIPDAQVQADWNEADTAAVDYIKNKPTIPAAQVQADWNEADNTAVDYIKNKPTIPAPVTVDSIFVPNSQNPVESRVIQGALDSKANMGTGATDPTTSTVGAVGDFYLNWSTKTLFQCVEIVSDEQDPPTYTYTWQQVGGGSNDAVIFYYKSSDGKLYESDWTTEVNPSDVYDWLIANPLTPALLVNNYYGSFYVAERWIYSNAYNTSFYYCNAPFSGNYNTYSVSNSGVYSSSGSRRTAAIQGGNDVSLYIPQTALTVGSTYTLSISRSYYFSGRYFSKDLIKALLNGDITAKCIYMGWTDYKLIFTVVNPVTISDYNGSYIMVLNGSYFNSTGGEITPAGDLTFLYSNTSGGSQQNIEIDSKIEIGPITLWYSSSWITP